MVLGSDATAFVLSDLLTAVGTVITNFLTQIPKFITVALQSPVVVLFIGIAVVWAIVRMAKKLLHF